MKPAAILAELQRRGLLLQADARLPSVATQVAGEPVRGSWWGHPKGKEIFRMLEQVLEHRDVLLVKLVDDKLTLVHRRLWPALLALALAREPWQTRGLSRAARALLLRLEARSELELPGAAAAELETRLLALGRSVHTPSGHHEKRLETWEHWAGRAGVKQLTDPRKARAALELARDRLGGGSLPWQART